MSNSSTNYLMNYRLIYMKIIFKAKSENRRKNHGIYYEKHHILPKSLFPKWAKEKRNIVLLTAKEHYFCHKLLMKIFPSQEMSLAYIRLTHDGKRKVSMKDYEQAKILNSKIMSERLKNKKMSGQWKKGHEPWNKGKPTHLNNEYSKALSKGQKRRFENPEERRKNSERVKLQMSSMTEEEKKKRIEKIKNTLKKNKIGCIKVKCVETGEIFDSIKEACKKYPGHINEVIKGTRKKAAGMHWELIN